MDKKQKKNSQKSAKPAKKSQPSSSKVVDEKPKKSEPKSSKPSYDLPAVQCKDTLLLDYDYSKQYSKRNLVSNWDKYAEPDDDDDNAQLSAADFEQLLSASKSVGDHFTFASERSWLQNDDDNEPNDGSIVDGFFKLNISNLRNGIGRLPFYLRQDLPKELFTDDEIANMHYKVNYIDNESNLKPSAGSEINQNLLNILTNKNVNEKSAEKDENKANHQSSKNDISAPTKKVEVKSIQETVAQSSMETELIDQLTDIQLTPTIGATAIKSNPVIPPASEAKSKSNKTEDIQDWLDDILNES